MPENPGQQPEIPAKDVPTADGTPTDGQQPVSQEAPASETQQTTVTNPNQPSRRDRAAAVEEYDRELAAAMVSAPVSEEQPQGTPAEEPEAPAEESTTGDEPAGEEATPQGEQPNADQTPTKPKEFRPRLNGIKDARQQEAILLVSTLGAEGERISLGEAERRIALKYGEEVQPPAGEQPAGQEQPPTRTAAEVKAEMDTLKEERRQAIREIDPDKQIEIEDKLDALREEQQTISQREKSAEVSANESFDRKVDESHAEAARFYPAVAEENHAIHDEAARIWATMEKTKNPIIHDETAPFQIYQMAANKLGIAPVDPAATPTPSPKAGAKPPSTPATPKPQAVPVTAVRRPTPAVALPNGGDRTTQAGPPVSPVEKIRSANDYDKFMEQVG